ncbi:MAG: ECF transporter S component [Ruminiclostridium sp.]|nr:ECF transporter S component [Ruminiclostridium sp.]
MEETEKKTALSEKEKNRGYVSVIAGMGVLTAIVVVLQLMSSVIHFGPFSITLALTPIIVGGALYGLKGGAWLGLVMAVTVLLSGDAAAFLAVSIPGTLTVVLVKSTAAGLLASLVYKLIEKKNVYLAVVAAGIAAPVVNTGLFIVGCMTFFIDTINEWSGGLPALEFIITGMVGLNFIVELFVNMALSAVTVTLIGYARKMLGTR